MFSGCGGGGGNIATNNTYTKDDTSTPTTQDNYNVGTYTDTYDIAAFLDGEWSGISMSGNATGSEGRFNVILSSMTVTIWGTQITGNTGTSYLTSRQDWDCYYQGTEYLGIYELYADAEKTKMQHVGINTWRCASQDGTIVIIQVLSNSTAMVIQEGTVNFGGHNYNYSVKGTMRKKNSGNYEINPTPEPQTDTQSTPQVKEDNSNLTSNYKLETLAGTWYAYNGSGTATGSSGTLELRLSSANVSFNNIQGTSNMNVTSTIRWDIYQNNLYSRTIVSEHSNERVSVQQLNNNSWSYTFSNIRNANTITIKFISDTNIEITETGSLLLNSRVYEYTASYTMTK